LIFLIQPLVVVFLIPASASGSLSHEHLLLYLLAIPALVPATLASYAVVGERQQGTLEPVLTTPIPREEFLLGKGLAALVPSMAIAYLIYIAFLACVELFAPAKRRFGPDPRPGLARSTPVHTPPGVLVLWIGIAISNRTHDVRTAAQLALLASLPSVLLTSLIAFDVIRPTVGLALTFAAALLVIDGARLAGHVGDVRPRTAHHGTR